MAGKAPVCISFGIFSVGGGGLDRKNSFLSGDTELSDLINNELSDSMYFYNEKARATDERISGKTPEFIADLGRDSVSLF